MTFSRRGPSGGDWPVGGKLTSVQINGIDVDHANAVDKTGDSVNGANITLSGTTNIALASRTLTRHMRYVAAFDDFTKWSGATAAVAGPTTVRCTAATLQYCRFPIALPNGSTWVSATLQGVTGAGGHAGLPGTMPAIFAYKTSLTSGTTTQIATQVDTSGSTGAYQSAHSIAVTGMTEVVDNTSNVYSVTFSTEAGANALANLSAFGVVITFTTTKYDDGS